MKYDQLPELNINLIRGVTARYHFGKLTKNDEEIILADSNIRVFIKSAVDASKCAVKKLTSDDGLDLSNNELTVIFGDWTIGMQAGSYYYDVYCVIDGDSKIILRGEINLSGSVSV